MSKLGNQTHIRCPHCFDIEANSDIKIYLTQGYKQLWCQNCDMRLPEEFARKILKELQKTTHAYETPWVV